MLNSFRFRYPAAARLVFLLLMGLLAARGAAWGQTTHDTRAGQALPGLPFWKWQNPTPQNYALNDLWAFTDSAALVVGSHGTALRTADQGRTWVPVPTGTDRDLVSVAFATPQVGWLGYSTPATNPTIHDGGVGPGEVRTTTNGGLTWTRQPIGENYSVRMRKVMPLSATTVVVFYEWGRMQNGFHSGFTPRLRRSINGGRNWTALPVPGPVSNWPTADVVFPTALVGLMGGGGGLYNYPGWLHRTPDGGLTWLDVTPDSGRFIVRSLFFADAQRGWVAGQRRTPTDGGTVLFRTLDGGLTWAPVPSPQLPTDGLTLIRFAPDGLHGVLQHGFGQEYLRTADGGLTWGGAIAGGTSWGFLLAPPIAQVRASGLTWLQPADNRLLVSRAFGDSARLTYAPNAFATDRFTNVQFPDPDVGWVGAGAKFVDFNGTWSYWLNGGNSVLRTTDRGAHWLVFALDSLTAGLVTWAPVANSFITTTAFPDRDTAYAAGVELEGTPQRSAFVVRTTDGGATWTRLPVPATRQAPIKMSFFDGRRGLIVGDSGLALLTTDAGLTWHQPIIHGRHRLYTAGWVDAQHAYAGGDSTNVARSADGGLTWAVQTYDSLGIFGSTRAWPAVGYPQNSTYLHFTTLTRGYRCHEGNAIERTPNGGATWWYGVGAAYVPDLYIQGGRTSQIQQVAFRTPQEGYAFGSDQFRTLDGGRTWTVWAQTTTTTQAGALVDRYNAYAVGYGGTILRYSEKFIQTDTTLTRTAFCLDATADSVLVPFTLEGTFAPAERDFRVELSNAKGRFRPGQTTLVGGGAASPLLARLPASLSAGTYRLRVIRADSTVLGADNGVDLVVSQRPAAVAVAPADSVAICAGDSVQLTAPAGFGQYQWSTGATTSAVWVRAAGAYAVRVGGAPDCLSPPSDSVRVRVKAVPAMPIISAAPQFSGITILTSGAATGNQWFLNGQPISGATGPTYAVTTATQSGTYSVQVTRGGCVSPVSADVVVGITGVAADAAGAALSLSPNPARGRVVVRAGGGALLNVTLTDLSGREVARVTGAGRAEASVSLAGIAAGTYLLRAEVAGGGALTRRLIVE